MTAGTTGIFHRVNLLRHLPHEAVLPGASIVGSPSEGRSPGSIRKGPGLVFQIALFLTNGGFFGLFVREYAVSVIGKCAKFRENGCKFNFILSLRARMRKMNVGVSNVRRQV
jgi:hypothetical protein